MIFFLTNTFPFDNQVKKFKTFQLLFKCYIVDRCIIPKALNCGQFGVWTIFNEENN